MNLQGNSVPKAIESAANEVQLFTVLFSRWATVKYSPKFVASGVLVSHADFTYCSTLPFRNKLNK